MDCDQQLRADALAIWKAGVAAVDSRRLVRDCVRVQDGLLIIGGNRWPLEAIDRIAVVGGGKAGAGMAAGVEAALGPELLAAKRVTGLVNVPADCLRPLAAIQLHAARPAGVNEPTEAGVEGTRRILEMVEGLGPRDLCICLISGGGSALLPAPVEGVSLADKQAVTRLLSGAGANIAELNTMRRQLSRIKGGGLARACRAGRLVTLIISDVLGDPLEVIASGPTVIGSDAHDDTPEMALAVLRRFADDSQIPRAVFEHLRRLAQRAPAEHSPASSPVNLVIGNNWTAVSAAAEAARALGYRVEAESNTTLEGTAEEVGAALADRARVLRAAGDIHCVITGGEPVVRLAPAETRGKGGRNQQLVLAALERLEASNGHDALRGLVLLSGGTDGEDGPTDAAGAIIDRQIAAAARKRKLGPRDYLARNDAYHFFEPLGGLIKTGPTHTNVCDLRVVLVEPE